eukprot:gene26958-35000_t
MAQDSLSDGPDAALVKIVFLGASGVGKTCTVKRLFSDQFDARSPATVGVDYFFKRYIFNDMSIGVTLWDTAGQERFRTITSSYYRGSQGAVFVYDVTRRETLDELRDFYIPEFDNNSTYREAVKLIIGNMTDKVKSADAQEGAEGEEPAGVERQVSKEEAAEFARSHGCMYYECSAKMDENVQDAIVWGLLATITDTPCLLRPPPLGTGPLAPPAPCCLLVRDWPPGPPAPCCLLVRDQPPGPPAPYCLLVGNWPPGPPLPPVVS